MTGKKVAVHCRQGIGRSGLIAASLLVVSGMNPESAFRQVSVARGLPTRETAEQENWVLQLARSLPSHWSEDRGRMRACLVRYE